MYREYFFFIDNYINLLSVSSSAKIYKEVCPHPLQARWWLTSSMRDRQICPQRLQVMFWFWAIYCHDTVDKAFIYFFLFNLFILLSIKSALRSFSDGVEAEWTVSCSIFRFAATSVNATYWVRVNLYISSWVASLSWYNLEFKPTAQSWTGIGRSSCGRILTRVAASSDPADSRTSILMTKSFQ